MNLCHLVIASTSLLCIFASTASGKVEAVLGSVPLVKNVNLPGILPSTDQPEILISRDQYLISYNKEKRAPNFAMWKLEANQIGKAGRSSSFAKDTELETYLQSTNRSLHAISPSEFNASCFDRGHVVPSDDRTDSVKNNLETFKMSNMVAQTPYLNRVVWEHLEAYTRDMVIKQNKKVYIIAGPIYDQNLGGIGPNKDIQVPTREFKLVIILDPKAPISSITKDTPMIPVILRNTDINGKPPVVNGSGPCVPFETGKENMNDWVQYRSTVQEIEKASGLTIFIPLSAAH